MKMRTPTIVMGALLTLGGIFCLIAPVDTFRMIGWLIGFLLLVAGVNLVVDYFTLRKNGSVNMWDLVGGLFTIILALIILYRHGYARNFLDDFIVVVFGVWMLFSGVFRIASAIQLKKAKESVWFLVLLGGVFALLLGVYGLFNPYVFKFAIGIMIGFFIIMQGLSLLGLGFMMRRVDIDKVDTVTGNLADDVTTSDIDEVATNVTTSVADDVDTTASAVADSVADSATRIADDASATAATVTADVNTASKVAEDTNPTA